MSKVCLKSVNNYFNRLLRGVPGLSEYIAQYPSRYRDLSGYIAKYPSRSTLEIAKRIVEDMQSAVAVIEAGGQLDGAMISEYG